MGDTKKPSSLADVGFPELSLTYRIFSPLSTKTEALISFLFLKYLKNTGKPKQSFSLLDSKGTVVTWALSNYQPCCTYLILEKQKIGCKLSENVAVFGENRGRKSSFS